MQPARALTFAICFDFPEVDDPVFASHRDPGEPMGITSTLKNAARFDTEAIAERVLRNSYRPRTSEYGVVVEVEQ